MSLDLQGAAHADEGVRSVGDLIAYIRAGEKPPDRFRVGVEHEKIGLRNGSLAALPYDGPGGIRAILDGLAKAAGGPQHSHRENGQPIAVLGDGASVTLEPGGQLELSGAPSKTLAAARKEIDAHLRAVSGVSNGHGAGVSARWLAAGYRPFGRALDMPLMPKGRYAAMNESLAPRGKLALDMMRMTATVQANLDWSDEKDLAAKVRASTSASPLVSALFANSPIVDGRDSGYLDYRYEVWRHTDAARCGLLEQMSRPDWTYRAYVEWAMDVPLLFVRKGDVYLDSQGQTFGDWMRRGVLANGQKLAPTQSSWADHLSTLFPEIRVKRVLEVRGADMVPPPLLYALPAVWVGLLYDPQACAAAWELTSRWSFADRLHFQAAVARSALQARGPGGVRAQDLARELLSYARAGLGRWAAVSGADERDQLDPLDEIAHSGVTLAERALERLRATNGDPESLVRFWQLP